MALRSLNKEARRRNEGESSGECDRHDPGIEARALSAFGAPRPPSATRSGTAAAMSTPAGTRAHRWTALVWDEPRQFRALPRRRTHALRVV